MPTVELRQVIGKYFDRHAMKVRRVAWDMDILLLDGKQISTINRVPGAPIGLLAGVRLTPGEEKAVNQAIAAKRGGVEPRRIGRPVSVPGTLLDDDDDELEEVEVGEETEVDGE